MRSLSAELRCRPAATLPERDLEDRREDPREHDRQRHRQGERDEEGRNTLADPAAHDPAVLNQIAGWGWTVGMRPDPQAPVWPMNAFRDRFLAAFGSQPAVR